MKPNFTPFAGILIIVSVLFLSFTTQAQTARRDGNAMTPINFSFAGANTANDAAQTANGSSNLVNGAVNLNWAAAQEQNDAHYEMERSLDGKNFSQIGIILGGFEDGPKTEYAYRDRSDALKNQNTAYYRLKQVDQKGNFSYSSIVTVSLKTSGDGALASK